jgi:hypothetical protein
MAQAKTKKVTVNAGGEKHVVYKKTTKKGEGKVGNIMVNHPTKDKGQWDTIDLTAKGRAKTIKQGVADTKRWHRENPNYNYKGKGLSKMETGGSTAAWTRKEGKNPTGGLNAKGVASYRRENPGSKLKMAVTTKPSKLDPDSKAAKRRKSFCARMSGVKGPMKDEKGRPTRKALSLRKWNC